MWCQCRSYEECNDHRRTLWFSLLCSSLPFTVSSKMFDFLKILYLSKLAKVSFNPVSCHSEPADFKIHWPHILVWHVDYPQGCEEVCQESKSHRINSSSPHGPISVFGMTSNLNHPYCVKTHMAIEWLKRQNLHWFIELNHNLQTIKFLCQKFHIDEVAMTSSSYCLGMFIWLCCCWGHLEEVLRSSVS